MYDDDYDSEDSDWQDENPADNTIECPGCGGEIFDDTPRCHLCGEYITGSNRRSGSVAGWKYYALIAIVVLTAVSFALPFIISLLQLAN